MEVEKADIMDSIQVKIWTIKELPTNLESNWCILNV